MAQKRQRTTQRDIAGELAVSTATVSMALRGDPRISEDLRRKVLRKAEDLGYSPDPYLGQLSSYRNLCRKKTYISTLAWLNNWDDPSDYFKFIEYKKYFEGAKKMAEKLGHKIEVFNLNAPKVPMSRLVDILESRNILGIIIPPHHEPFLVPDCLRKGFTIVRLGFGSPSTQYHIVGADQYEGGRMAAKEMRLAGYTRIAYVSNRLHELKVRSNFGAGFNATRDLEVREDERIPSLIFDVPEPKDGIQQFKQWLTKHNVEAVLSNQPGLEQWVLDLGLKFGCDLGFAGTSYCDLGDPQVDSGIDQQPQEIGAAAINFLSQMLIHHEKEAPSVSQRLLIKPIWRSGTSLVKESE